MEGQRKSVSDITEQGPSTGPGCAFGSFDDPSKVPALQSVGLYASRRPYCKGLEREKVGLVGRG